ncbi:ATP-binding protein [Streptomyces antnestii]|uniref:ATP-binding protein n=1 Tax=Streptomyces antnestii TaxID=2494256 RepID=A0A3S2VSJ9_9ACTN|nr:ATP/GTP-binding protein [Streptomyces sp. San01]RVU19922.1 ATP-binding protein [Streptomyces sp. San01]
MKAFEASDDIPLTALKIVIAGGFGVGKTTMVATVSEIEPLTTEEILTTASAATDSLAGVENKTTTTVSMDFGRITLWRQQLQLLLFGTPGQDRFWFMWDDLALGSIGAVVLADTRRLDDCFSAVEFFEDRGVPFVVAVNEFDTAHRYTAEEVQAAIELNPDVPVIMFDARAPYSTQQVLIRLVEYALTLSLRSSPESEPVLAPPTPTSPTTTFDGNPHRAL